MFFTEGSVIFWGSVSGVGCLLYILTRYRRSKRASWGWLAMPCFGVALMYAWFHFGNVPTADRILPVRAAWNSLFVLITIITFTVSYFDYRNGRRISNTPTVPGISPD